MLAAECQSSSPLPAIFIKRNHSYKSGTTLTTVTLLKAALTVVCDDFAAPLALIDRNFQGLGKELFTDAGKYVIHFGGQPQEAAEQAANIIQAAHPDKPPPPVTAVAKYRNPGLEVITTSTADQLVSFTHTDMTSQHTYPFPLHYDRPCAEPVILLLPLQYETVNLKHLQLAFTLEVSPALQVFLVRLHTSRLPVLASCCQCSLLSTGSRHQAC